jgi:type II secretory pathway component PulM
LDARYVTRAAHREDVRDSLWEVQALKREVAELRREVESLRRQAKAPAPDGALTAKVQDAHRLATEAASAVDHLLQAEVLLWQAVDGLREDGGTEHGSRASSS